MKTLVTAVATAAILSFNANASTQLDAYLNYDIGYEGEGQVYFGSQEAVDTEMLTASLSRSEGYEGEGQIFSEQNILIAESVGFSIASNQYDTSALGYGYEGQGSVPVIEQQFAAAKAMEEQFEAARP
jgi:hypothetical protein